MFIDTTIIITFISLFCTNNTIFTKSLFFQ